MSPNKSDPPAPEPESGYVVLARRYRPSQFSQVIGQDAVTRTLQNAISADRVHHAYLFTGSRGVGKTTVARIMAKALNCDAGTSADPCDTCDSCVDIREGRSVDVYEIDGASHTGVDDVRELRESVRYMPARSRYKIFIIDEVHMLSTSAFNALLKTLEEPPPHVVFIFATTEPHKIPATILSRCQRFGFKRVPAAKLVAHMADLSEREKQKVEPEGLALLARASEGSVRDSLSLLDQVFAYATGRDEISSELVSEVLGVADRRVLFDLSEALLARDAGAALKVVSRLFDGGLDLSQFTQAFLAHLRDLTVVRTCKGPAELVEATEAELSDLEAQAKGEGGELLPQHFDRFARAAEEIARSAFPRLILEMAIIEMVHAEPLLPVGELIERLEQLEGRLGGGGGSPAPAPRPGASRAGGSRGGGDVPSARGGGRRGTRAASTEPAISAATQPAVEAAAVKELEPPPAQKVPEPVSDPVQLPAQGEEMQRWQELLKRVEKVVPAAASPFFSGKLVSWKGRAIKLGYLPGAFEADLATEVENLGPFQAECARQTGGPMRVEILEVLPGDLKLEVGGQAKRSAMEEREIQRLDRQKRLRTEARGHELTRAIIDELDAEIVTIRTEADES